MKPEYQDEGQNVWPSQNTTDPNILFLRFDVMPLCFCVGNVYNVKEIYILFWPIFDEVQFDVWMIHKHY